MRMFRGIDLPLICFTSAFTNLPLLTPMAKLAIEVIVSSLRRSTKRPAVLDRQREADDRP
jgi:hypothetical protein